MAIENPDVVQFMNEEIRQISEGLRRIDYRIQSALIDWQNRVAAVCPIDGDDVIDPHRATHVMTGNDIHVTIGTLSALKALMDVPGRRESIQKGCVRALEVTL